MTDKIVTFPGNTDEPEEELIMVCTRCNCRSWRLLSSGNIECCNCDNVLIVDEFDKVVTEWRKWSETAPKDTSGLSEDSGVNVRSMGNHSFACRSVTKRIETWAKNEELVFVGGYKTDGEGAWWLGAETAEQRDWIVRKAQEIIDHTKNTTFPDEEKNDGIGDKG